MQIRNLDQSVTDLVQEKNNLLETVVEKDEKIQTLEADLERTIDQNHMQIQNLEESVSKNTDLEQILAEKDEKIKTLEEIDIVSNQNLSIEMFLIRLIHLKEISNLSDLISESENAMEVLQGKIYPLKLGYYGCILRSQKDIEKGVSIE